MCKLQHDTTPVTSSTTSRSSLENPSAFFFFFCLVTRGLLRFITIVAREHLLNVKRFLGIFQCFAKARLHLLHSFWESSYLGWFMILILWFDRALKQKHNHERCSNVFALQANLPLSKMVGFCFLGFLTCITLWVRTRSLAEASWHCCNGFGEAEHLIRCLSAA